jgi:hypothetical protein
MRLTTLDSEDSPLIAAQAPWQVTPAIANSTALATVSPRRAAGATDRERACRTCSRHVECIQRAAGFSSWTAHSAQPLP